MIGTIITILIVYLVYFFVSVARYDKNGYLKQKGKSFKKKYTNDDKIDAYKELPAEAKFFIRKYNIDIDKLNFRGFLKVIGLILGVDITIVSFFVLLIFKNVVVQILVASLLIIPVYLISLIFLGSYFKKKGMIKNV